jgi:hypothetical protein
MTPRSLISPLAVALATCALAPVAASAAPVIEGQGIAAGGGPGVTAEQFAPRSLAAPDQVDRTNAGQTKANVYVPPTPEQAAPTNPAPTWPSNPQPLATRHAPATAGSASDNDGGLDTGIWIALSGGALVAAGGVGFAGRKRLQVVRKRQLA